MFFDVVESHDQTGQAMVTRVPAQGSGEFNTGSQVVVHDSQVAVFYRDGRMADQFRGGRYTLSTQNLPVLKSLVKVAFGGKSPFRASVFFVSLKSFTDLGWGTPQPVLFRDSEFKMVNLRANGTFALRVQDHVRFLNTLVGTQGLTETPAIHDYVRKIIASRFARILPEVLTTVVDLAASYQTLEVKLKQATSEDLSQYGLALVDLLVMTITLPPDVQETINRGVGMRSLDQAEVAKYQQVAAADALRTAAESGGGGALTGGLGIGAGLAMGQQFANNVTPSGGAQQQPPQEAKLTMPELKAKLAELKEMLAEELITQDDFDKQKARLLNQL
jgi:membrane protease subunit (stomatin/prohibitin family)